MVLADPDDDRLAGRPRRPFRDAAVLACAVLALVAAAVWWSSAPEGGGRGAALGYAGDRSCRDCHPGESASHSRSGHARTLRRAASTELARSLDGTSVADPELAEVVWTYSLKDQALTTERARAGGADVRRWMIEYAFGSGRHAVTFVSMLDRDPGHPSLLEHRLTSFAHRDKPGLTPGQSLGGHASGNTPEGRIHDAFNTRACFECHTTLISDGGSDRLDTTTMVPNVGCERCHGPARSHAEAARRGETGSSRSLKFGVGKWTAAEQMQACGVCHRLPGMVKPSDVRVENPVIVRHQTVGLTQSVCYAKARGTLNCVTCHDPHARVSKGRDQYEKACLSCHGAPAQTPCRVSPRSGCVGCHMPRRDVARGMMMTDHWIRKPAAPVPRPDKSSVSGVPPSHDEFIH